MTDHGVIYTASFGPRGDVPRPPECEVPEGTLFICFTDKDTVPKPWQRVVSSFTEVVHFPELAAKQYKLLPYLHFSKSVPWSLWIDACMTLKKFPYEALETPPDTFWAVRANNKNIEAEGGELAWRGLLPAALIRAQTRQYRAAGFPERLQLTASGFLFRRHHHRVCVKWSCLWWHEVKTWAFRDMLSLDYAAWRAGMTLHALPGTPGRNASYIRHKHEADGHGPYNDPVSITLDPDWRPHGETSTPAT